MRLAGQEKLGYYPPPRITSIIRERLDFTTTNGQYAALDPCAGEGIALAQLTQDTGAKLFGIEPDQGRCTEARNRFYRVLHSTREESVISHASFSILFLNPPYDEEHEINEDGKKKTTRKEVIFLQQTLPYLAPQGVLVFIVPAHILLRPDVVLYLTQKLDNLELWHFPEPERSEFKQAVAIGTKSTGKAINPALARITEEVPYDRPAHVVPPSNPDVKIFRSNRINPAELAAQAQTSPLLRFFSGTEATRPTERRPPLSLHNGHLSLLLANGSLDGLCGTGPDRHVVRGKTTKYHRVSSDTTVNDETGTTTKTTKTRDAYRVSLKLLRPTGQILELE